MKVVVTSPSFSTNQLLKNEILKYFPNATFNSGGKRFTQTELIENVADAEAIVVGLEKLNEDTLKKLPKLKFISKYGVGLNNIDLQYCNQNNIQIGWTGGVNKLSVAEMTLGYILMLCRNLYVTSNQLKSGTWNKSGGFQLSNKKVGVIGVGHIGKELIRLLKPFNCEIFANDIINIDSYCFEHGLIKASKEEIFSICDVVTIHTPLDASTENMVNIKVFQSMKKSAFLINSARGGIVNENDLKIALKEKIIAGAAIDAYIEEPPTDIELLSLPNLICTPHIGGNAKEAIEAMGMSAIEHLRRFYNL